MQKKAMFMDYNAKSGVIGNEEPGTEPNNVDNPGTEPKVTKIMPEDSGTESKISMTPGTEPSPHQEAATILAGIQKSHNQSQQQLLGQQQSGQGLLGSVHTLPRQPQLTDTLPRQPPLHHHNPTMQQQSQLPVPQPPYLSHDHPVNMAVHRQDPDMNRLNQEVTRLNPVPPSAIPDHVANAMAMHRTRLDNVPNSGQNPVYPNHHNFYFQL